MELSASLCVLAISTILHLSLGESSKAIIVRINPPYLKYARPNSSFSFFCEISKELTDFFHTYKAQFVFQAPNNLSAVVLFQFAHSNSIETHKEKYNVSTDQKLVDEMSGVMLTLKILTVRDLDEGNYTCLVKLNSTDEIIDKSSTQVQILRPIEDLCIKVDDLDEICHAKVDPIEVDGGQFKVACTARGSNPAPTVHLYHQGQPITTVDNKTELLDTVLSKYRSSLTATVNVPFSNERQEFVCVGVSELNNKTIKFPFKFKEYEPDIDCNKSLSTKGQQKVILTCSVDLKGTNATRFMYESDNQTFAFDTGRNDFVGVRPGDLSQKDVIISLTLGNVPGQDFTNFYLIIEHANGERTRHSVELQPISGTRQAKDLATGVSPPRLESLMTLGVVLALGCMLSGGGCLCVKLSSWQ